MVNLPFRQTDQTTKADPSLETSHITSIDLPYRTEETVLPLLSTAPESMTMTDGDSSSCPPYDPIPVAVASRAQTAADWCRWAGRFLSPIGRIHANSDYAIKEDAAGWDWRDYRVGTVAPRYEFPEDKTKLVVRLEQNDTLGAVRELRRRTTEGRIGIVCPADPSTPGGGFITGGSGEEEDLCHLSTLYPRLNELRYPLHDYQMLYAEGVWVMKEKVPGIFGGRALPESDWYSLDVILAAAVANPPTEPVAHQDGDGNTVTYDCYRDPADRQTIENKIRYILMLAMRRSIRRLVIGAFGCGAHGHPAREVAQIIKDILIEGDKYEDRDGPEFNFALWHLSEIVIAIDDPAPGKPVWNEFVKVFRQDKGMHTANQACEPEGGIQYTSFEPRYGAAD